MKKYTLTMAVLLVTYSLQGQGITGMWHTIDDQTKEEKAIIEIYQDGGGYYAKIVKNLIGEIDAICGKCEGDKKDQPIRGLVIIENVQKNGSKYDGGQILDPESGKTYKCLLKLEKDGRLKVRGYIGMPALGRTQYWVRKEK